MDTQVLADTEYYQGGWAGVISDRERVSGDMHKYTWIRKYWPTLNTIWVADQDLYLIVRQCQGKSTCTQGYASIGRHWILSGWPTRSDIWERKSVWGHQLVHMDTQVLADTEYYQGVRPGVISDRERVSGDINSYIWIH